MQSLNPKDEQRGATIRVRDKRPRSKGPRPLPVLHTIKNLAQLRLKHDELPQILRRKLQYPTRHHKRRDRMICGMDGRPRHGSSEQPTAVPLRYQQVPNGPRQTTGSSRPTDRRSPQRHSKLPTGPSFDTKKTPPTTTGHVGHLSKSRRTSQGSPPGLPEGRQQHAHASVYITHRLLRLLLHRGMWSMR